MFYALSPIQNQLQLRSDSFNTWVPLKMLKSKGDLAVAMDKHELSSDSEVEEIIVKKYKPTQEEKGMYLDTINRSVLDFDFEKLCSVSLLNINVYCCLVCGKYFQGRGKTSHAYFHSMDDNHHVFINLHTFKVNPLI